MKLEEGTKALMTQSLHKSQAVAIPLPFCLIFIKQLCSLELGSVYYREGNGNPPQSSCLENPIGRHQSRGSQRVGQDRATATPSLIQCVTPYMDTVVFFLFYEIVLKSF